MSFDPVHDTQAVYRILLDCMSRPGAVGNLAEIRDRIGLDAPLDKGFLLLGLTLLDGETSFSIPGVGVLEAGAAALAEAEAFLARMCSCRIETSERAAFLFLPPGLVLTAEGTGKAVEGAYRGTFMEPHLGATVLLGIGDLSPAGSEDSEPPVRWTLEGPGVNGTAGLSCGLRDGAILREVLRARETACTEFPLGVDLIILDAAARVTCIPRTTAVREA